VAEVREPGGEDLRRLRDVLVDHYSRARFEVELGQLDQNLEAITVDRDMPTIVGRVLLDARRGGWLPRLLDWATQEPYPRVAAVAGELLAGPGLWSRTCLGGDPFLGRPGLRRLLRAAIMPGNSPVFAVTGPAGSGRSYTARFVEHVAGALGGYHTTTIELGDVVADSAASVKRIRQRLGLTSANPPADRQSMTLGDPAADRLGLTSSDPSVDRLADDLQVGGRHILLLDGLDDAGARSAPALLADRLRARPVRGLTLILLGADPGLVDVPIERITPITAAQVAEHLAELAERAGLVLEPGVSDEFTAWVLHRQPAADAVGARVRRLAAALSRRAAR